MVQAGKRKVYFPIYYIEPYQTNEQALGLDVYSNPVHRTAIDKARDSGKNSRQ